MANDDDDFEVDLSDIPLGDDDPAPGFHMKGHALRTCIVCKHEECSLCDDWCDVLLDERESGMCCDGKCSFGENEKPGSLEPGSS